MRRGATGFFSSTAWSIALALAAAAGGSGCDERTPCTTCPAGQICYYGACVPDPDAGDSGTDGDARPDADGDRADVPDAETDTRPDADGETGADADADGTDLSEIEPDAEAEACTDACTTEDARYCGGGNRILACTRGADGCLHPSVEADCTTTGQLCSDHSGAPECIGGTGDACADAHVLLDLPYAGTGISFTTDFADDVVFGGIGCGTGNGEEAIFLRHLEAGETVRLRADGTSDLLFRVLRECSPTADCLAYRDEPEETGLSFTATESGNYYLVVESYYATSVGAYSFTISAAATGDTCADPIPIPALPWTFAGDDFVADFGNDLRAETGAGCRAAAGVEAVFTRDMTAHDQLVVSEDNGGLDLVLQILTECTAGAACVAAADDPETPFLTFTAATTGTYYFVVETYYELPLAPRNYSITFAAP